MTQVTFRTGARPPKHAPALQFAEFRRTGAAAPAEAPSYPAVDYLSRFSDWQVLGNDVASNCGAVWWANDRRMVTGTLTDTEVYPSQDQVWQLYETQNPLFDPNDPTSFGGPNDQGMEMQTLLEHLVTEGGPDGVKALGFAQVNHEDLDEVKAAISTGGRLLFVVTVSQAQQEQFGTGQPWDFDATSPVDGQHAMLIGGHDDDPAHDLEGLTWGEESVLTDNFFRKAVVQAWLVIWPEHRKNRQFLAGMDLEAFAAKYAEITGRPFPTEDDPAPSPAPVPDPAPVVPGPPVVPDPAPVPISTDPDEVFAGYLRDHLVNYPFDWEAVIALRHAAVRWLRARNLGGEQMDQIEDGVDGDREVIESTPVDPNRLHAADQAAQAANDGEYAPSTDARSRHVLEDRAERAAVVADIQAEALDDQRQREGLAGRAGEPVGEEAEPVGREAETGEGEPAAEVVDRSPSAEPVRGAHSTTQDS